MEKTEITLSFDSEKMDALMFYLKRENTNAQEKMEEALRLLYERTVPEPAREFLDAKSMPAARPKRPARPSQSRAAAPKPVSDPAGAGDENSAAG